MQALPYISGGLGGVPADLILMGLESGSAAPPVTTGGNLALITTGLGADQYRYLLGGLNGEAAIVIPPDPIPTPVPSGAWSFDDMVAADAGLLVNAFGIPAVLSGGPLPLTVSVVFDHVSIDHNGIMTDKPQVTIATAALVGLDLKTAVLTVKGINYRILKPLDDGYGISLATLTRL